jgi:hypothetical protein
VTDVARIDGRNAVSTRALERTVRAIAAQHLGVKVDAVSVQLADDGGLLAVAITGPLKMQPLRSEDRGDGILTRIQAARAAIRDDITTIADSRVGLVDVTISSVIISDTSATRRVK